jgi:hypothetical protein
MAHKGVLWPIDQRLRLYNDWEFWPEWIPRILLMSADVWMGTTPSPGTIVDAPAELVGWTPGDFRLELKTANIGTGPEEVRIGVQRRVLVLTHQTETLFQVWVDGVEQMGGPLNVFQFTTWSNSGPAFPALGRLPAATLWPTIRTGWAAKLW